MAKITTDNLTEQQDHIPDMIDAAGAITDALECAEGCETVADFIANLDEAITEALALVEKLKKLKRGELDD